MAVTLNEGNTNKLVITIPAKGDTDWAGIFQAAMQVISDHDHSGNGKGAAITLLENSVTENKINDGAVTTAKIADTSVTTSKIADANVTTAKIADQNVTTAKIADSNITTDKIADANVTASKIASDVVLSTLNDVSSTAPSTSDRLEWDGTEWAPSPLVFGEFNTAIPGGSSGFGGGEVVTFTSINSQGISGTGTTSLTLPKGSYLITLELNSFQGGMYDSYIVDVGTVSKQLYESDYNGPYTFIRNITSTTGSFQLGYDDDGNGSMNPTDRVIITRI